MIIVEDAHIFLILVGALFKLRFQVYIFFEVIVTGSIAVQIPIEYVIAQIVLIVVYHELETNRVAKLLELGPVEAVHLVFVELGEHRPELPVLQWVDHRTRKIYHLLLFYLGDCCFI